MKTINLLRFFSIISYLLIILMGQMIGLPFICWLLFTIFDIGNIDQVFAFLGVIGIILNFTKWKNNTLITILSFLLMLSPLIGRMIQTPIELFNYAAFKIPVFVFIIGYSTFIVLNVKNKKLQAT
ncbi:hypothetical protein [Chryseobacterium contaminans]|uniref:hypothetical protein n=1 Tax=Chryseobacterium contaminans TaxID=1423959 RepID=UPI00301864DB